MGPASFRGVPFHVDTAERGGGRRGVTHEYPFRDQPFREDLGKAAIPHTLEGYVLGDDYLVTKDRLLAALEDVSGPGPLIHPYYGTRQVAVLSFRVRESAVDGGMARFSIEFQETEAAPVQPKAVPDPASRVSASAGAARAAVKEAFLVAYAPGVHMEAVADALGQAALAANSALASPSRTVQEAAAVKLRVEEVQDSAAALVRGPELLLGTLDELFEGFLPRDFSGLLLMYSFNPGERPEESTSNREVEAANFDTFQRVVQRLVAVRAAELVTDVTFTNYEEAVAARDAVTAMLDEQMEQVSDDSYPALLQLRADVVQAVPSEESQLPRLLTFTPAETVPSLVLAYQLYGSLALEADLIERNRLAHPAFIRGGQPLEVLSDG